MRVGKYMDGVVSLCVDHSAHVPKQPAADPPAAPLGPMTVAALLPQGWEFRLVDENVRSLQDSDLEWADIVLVSGMLPQQKGILKAIQRAHEVGKPVVVGGPDPSSQPNVYGEADYVVIGEGEVTIPAFVEDLGRGACSGLYRCRCCPVS